MQWQPSPPSKTYSAKPWMISTVIGQVWKWAECQSTHKLWSLLSDEHDRSLEQIQMNIQLKKLSRGTYSKYRCFHVGQEGSFSGLMSETMPVTRYTFRTFYMVFSTIIVKTQNERITFRTLGVSWPFFLLTVIHQTPRVLPLHVLN